MRLRRARDGERPTLSPSLGGYGVAVDSSTWSFGTPGATPFGPFDVAWGEAGVPDGPRIVLLHGLYAGAHGYEWRELAPLLAVWARVRVPDLLGAGRSDRPSLAYTPAIIERQIEAVVADAGEHVHVVASSLTGAHALRAALHGVMMSSLTLITPTGMGKPRETARARRGTQLFDVLRATPLGDGFVRLLTSGPSIAWFQRNRTYADPRFLTDEEVDETRRAGRLPGAKHLQLAFVLDRLSIDIVAADVAARPVTVVWGAGQKFVDRRERDRWQAAGATVVDSAAGLPHVEEPQPTAQLLRDIVNGLS